MRILIVGDLMGASADEAPPIDRRPVLGVISVDTFDDVFADSSRPWRCRLWD